MAKDGTMRGGARPGTGPKKKALTEKISTGNPGGRELTVIDFGEAAAGLAGQEMPPVKDFLKAKQKDGKELCAEDVYTETWKWLQERGCAHIVGPQLIEQYAMSVARWMQCESAISEFGFLAKHPTTGGAMSSPYVSMARDYMKQVNQQWYQIFQIVKENCTSEFSGATPQDDVMERLLRARKGNM